MTTEARNLGVLLVDIYGVAHLHEKLGSMEADHFVKRCLRRVERAAQSANGHITRETSSQIQIVFASASVAAQATGDIQSQVSVLPRLSGIKPAIRIGFHYGQANESDGNSGVSGPAASFAAHLADLAKPDQVLTTTETAALLSAEQRQHIRAIKDLTVAGESGTIKEVCEMLWNHHTDAVMPVSSQPTVRDARLHLRMGNDEFWLSADQPDARIGRDQSANFIIRNTWASRNHSRIELRHGKYVLIDESTNGTFVKFSGAPEFVLKHEEAILHGHGSIAFGHPTEDAEDNQSLLEFEVYSETQ